MRTLYCKPSVWILVSLLILAAFPAFTQTCPSLTFSYTVTESRCISTGSITVNATGGSGNYNYKVVGPVTTSFTASNVLSGLSAGSYTVIVEDATAGCTVQQFNVVITGSYNDPRFQLTKTDASCSTAADGSIAVASTQYGRLPFTYTIMAPSPSSVGASNNTGTFTNLIAGEYIVQLTDSCGGQQTRRITIASQDWWIDTAYVNRVNCSDGNVFIFAKDSKGNLNDGNPAFNGFLYGVVRSPGDTLWSPNAFSFTLGNRRTATLVVKDLCGINKYYYWTDKTVLSLGAVVTSAFACNTFSATVTGQQNLINPVYDLYNSSAALIASNNNGLFTGIPYGSYTVQMHDLCFDTVIARTFSAVAPIPSLGATVTISGNLCTTFTATITGQTNLTNPQYSLYDAGNNLLSTNTTGVFTNVPYGNNCIRMHNDACYDTIISRCFTVLKPVPAVAAGVTTSALACSTFTVGITGQVNLTNPQYCLYDNANVLVLCNTTGSFTGLAYGSYCIRIQNDPCYDTIINRCFTVNKAVPAVGASATIFKRTCTSYSASMNNQVNLNNPQYSLYDGSNTLVATNTTGSFGNLTYGINYCIRMQNSTACYDTLISRCFKITQPVPTVGAAVTISNKSCSTVTVTITGQANLTTPTYNLYNAANSLIASNTTGIFNNVVYGSYCIDVVNTCYDTTIRRCFVAARSIPVAGTTVISNKTCATFAVTDTTGQLNLNNPQYTLYNAANSIVTSNTTGIFTNVPYGNYCIHIYDPCYDTTMLRCFAGVQNPITINAAAVKSCTIGASDIVTSFVTGTGPFTVQVYNPAGALVQTIVSPTSPVTVTGLPGLPAGQQYKVKGTDNCTAVDSQFVGTIISTMTKSSDFTSKCPSANWENGLGDIDVDASSNRSAVIPVIISKNGSPVSIPYTTNAGNHYQFSDLGEGTYIVDYTMPGCNTHAYDTLTIPIYNYPNLQKSTGIQCDNNSFSIGAVATGGTAPFTYEIIGSTPSTPSIVAPPQASPVFSINNGTTYSLVRLRAIDGCGNAKLNDVSILPVANATISASSDCYYNTVVLQADTISNATYQWFRKTSPVDSVLVGSNDNYQIAYMLPTDTGTYVCKLVLNSGCVTQVSSFTLTGSCGTILGVKLTLSGTGTDGQVPLTWTAMQDNTIREYQVERWNDKDNRYVFIGTVMAAGTKGNHTYSFTDKAPVRGKAYYRLKVISIDNKISYSNIITVDLTTVTNVSVYPNPVKDNLTIRIAGKEKQSYQLTLQNTTGQIVYQNRQYNVQQGTIQYQRDERLKAGVYLLHVVSLTNGNTYTYKVLFK